jgi:uncharacterized membrane protein YphA (DoxX/SURF4 family)
MVCICLTLWVAEEIGEFEGGIGVALGLFEGFATCAAFVGLNLLRAFVLHGSFNSSSLCYQNEATGVCKRRRHWGASFYS